MPLPKFALARTGRPLSTVRREQSSWIEIPKGETNATPCRRLTSWPPVRCSPHQVDWRNIFSAPLVALSPLSTTARGASGSGSLRISKIQNTHFQISIFTFFENVQKTDKSELTFGETTFQPSPKRCNVFSLFLPTPHPRVNDEVKLEGGSKICTRAVATSLIRGCGGG